MKKMLSFSLFVSEFAYAQSFKIPDPEGTLFDGDNKVTGIVNFVDWIVKGGAGLFGVGCLILAGNYMNRGEYGKAIGAGVGGVVSAIAPYIVQISQTGA